MKGTEEIFLPTCGVSIGFRSDLLRQKGIFHFGYINKVAVREGNGTQRNGTQHTANMFYIKADK